MPRGDNLTPDIRSRAGRTSAAKTPPNPCPCCGTDTAGRSWMSWLAHRSGTEQVKKDPSLPSRLGDKSWRAFSNKWRKALGLRLLYPEQGDRHV
jgi:hypothetical protein